MILSTCHQDVSYMVFRNRKIDVTKKMFYVSLTHTHTQIRNWKIIFNIFFMLKVKSNQKAISSSCSQRNLISLPMGAATFAKVINEYESIIVLNQMWRLNWSIKKYRPCQTDDTILLAATNAGSLLTIQISTFFYFANECVYFLSLALSLCISFSRFRLNFMYRSWMRCKCEWVLYVYVWHCRRQPTSNCRWYILTFSQQKGNLSQSLLMTSVWLMYSRDWFLFLYFCFLTLLMDISAWEIQIGTNELAISDWHLDSVLVDLLTKYNLSIIPIMMVFSTTILIILLIENWSSIIWNFNWMQTNKKLFNQYVQHFLRLNFNKYGPKHWNLSNVNRMK